MPRPPYLYVVVGMKRTGKSKLTIDILREMVKIGRKSLILDTQNEYSDPALYPDIRTLPYNKVSLWTIHPEVSIRRIPPFHWNGDEMTPDEKAELVIHILRHIRNGTLLLEDINDYIYDYMPQDIVGKILSQRHKGTDIVMHFHSLGAIQKKIWRHINVIRMHKCEDSVIDNKDKFPYKYEFFCIAENLVNDQFFQGNKFFTVEILVNDRKITGAFTTEDRDNAIELYIRGHYAKLIRPYLNQVDRLGSRKYTAGTAFEAETLRICSMYFQDQK
jgi:hypothetical protein